MAFVYVDRVQETTLTVGTGPLSLLGPTTGFRTFNEVGVGNQTYYAITDDTTNEWEVGVGTYSPGSLSRDTVLASSNSNALVVFGVGPKTVFATAAAQFFGNALSTLAHAAINHTGIPGVPSPEAFTNAVHAATDHTGITGVPLPEAFTNAVHAALNHTGIPGVGDLSTAAHAALNHTGIPGVGDLSTAAHAALNHELIPGVAAISQQLLSTVIPVSPGITAYSIPADTLTNNGDVLALDMYILNQSGVSPRTLTLRIDPSGPGVSHTLFSAYSMPVSTAADVRVRLIRVAGNEGLLLTDIQRVGVSAPAVPDLLKSHVVATAGTINWATIRLVTLFADGGGDLVLRHMRVTRQRAV
jgi:hypothetical protein